MSRRILDTLYLGVLALTILAGTPFVPFHGDEATQIYMSRDYAYQFIERDLARVAYVDPAAGIPYSAQEQDLRLLNGTLNKYLIGLAWHIAGFTAVDLNEQWDWGADWNYNQTTGHAPTPDLLQIARLPSALLTAGGVVLMFALGVALGGRPVGYLAALSYTLHPTLLINGRRAMMEGSLLFFALLAVWAGVWLLQSRGRKAGIVLGLAAGLALASKHTAIFTLAAVFAACGLAICAQFVRGQRQLAARGWVSLCIAGGLAAITFLALNPAWWSDPAARAGDVLARRQALLDGQAAAFGGYPTAADALSGFIAHTLDARPQYYEIAVWESYIGDQIAAYEASFWDGIAPGDLSVSGVALGAILVSVCIGIGVIALIRERDPQTSAARWIVGIWALAVTITTLAYTPLGWARYYLLMQPILALLIAVGIMSVIRRYAKNKRDDFPFPVGKGVSRQIDAE